MHLRSCALSAAMWRHCGPTCALPFLELAALHPPLPSPPSCRSVYCAQARSLAVNSIDGLAAPGKWVDFGLRSLSVGLHLAEEDEEEAELEIVDFPYGA